MSNVIDDLKNKSLVKFNLTEIQNSDFDFDIFQGIDFQYIYISKDGKVLTLAKNQNEELDKLCYKKKFSENSLKLFQSTEFCNKYIELCKQKEKKEIKFIPPDYLINLFSEEQLKLYFLNGNNVRWKKIVEHLNLDKLEGKNKEIALLSLIKGYYIIGGFSKDQAESEKAFQYAMEHFGKINPYTTLEDFPKFLEAKFSRIKLPEEYNKSFAKFFMRYFKDDPNFMTFESMTEDGWYFEHDFLADAHNNFETILKNYPHKVVSGNETRALLTPEFVARRSKIKTYTGVISGNEKLADTIGMYDYTQNQFELIQLIYEAGKKQKSLISANSSKDKSLITFRLLAKDDPLGFILGDITNCCQKIGDTGASCVEDGYVNPYAGFMVFEEKLLDERGKINGETRIIGQAYVWYDPITLTVCYDNIEIPTKMLDMLKLGEKNGKEVCLDALANAIEQSAIAIITSMNGRNIPVEQVTIGEGFNNIRKYLREKFEVVKTPLAKHRHYIGYSDASIGQLLVKRYDEITRRYSKSIRDMIKKAKQNIASISEKGNDAKKF